MNIFLKDKPQAGIVGVGNSHKGISAFLQHRVAGTGTHAFIIDYPDGTQKQYPRVFESDMRVSHALWTTYLKDKDFDFWLYEVVGATTEEIDYALEKIPLAVNTLRRMSPVWAKLEAGEKIEDVGHGEHVH